MADWPARRARHFRGERAAPWAPAAPGKSSWGQGFHVPSSPCLQWSSCRHRSSCLLGWPNFSSLHRHKQNQRLNGNYLKTKLLTLSAIRKFPPPRVLVVIWLAMYIHERPYIRSMYAMSYMQSSSNHMAWHQRYSVMNTCIPKPFNH